MEGGRDKKYKRKEIEYTSLVYSSSDECEK